MILRSDRGQATVEFALILPLALACLALVIQTLIVVTAQVALLDDTRRAARIASVASDPAAAVRDMQATLPTRTEIDVETSNGLVTVVLRRKIAIAVPLLRRLNPTIDLEADLTMALEPPIHLVTPPSSRIDGPTIG